MHNTKASGYILSLTSYYIEATINKGLSTTVSLLNKAILSAGDVVYVKNLTTQNTLTLGATYTIGDDRKSIVTSSQSAGDMIEVKYNQYYAVKGSNLTGEKISAGVDAKVLDPSIRLSSQVGIR